MKRFERFDLKTLWRPDNNSSGDDNGSVTIIGGSELFTGAPLLAMMAAARMVDNVFLATPDSDKGAAEKTALFSQLKSLIWVPKEDVEKYIYKSDAVLIGPGMMRYSSEGKFNDDGVFDHAGTETRMLTQYLLSKYADKKWVIDGGSLQVVDSKWIPNGAVVTPNAKEYQILFGEEFQLERMKELARKQKCVIVYKGAISYVSDGEITYEVTGGNAGLTKGGTGDTLAGLTVGLLAKNPPLLAAAAASFVIKQTADVLYERVGFNYNADDVAANVFEVMNQRLSE